MSATVLRLRACAVALMAVALLAGRLALDLHPCEHPLDAGSDDEHCHACVSGGSPALEAGV